jgi:hypothetical protein
MKPHWFLLIDEAAIIPTFVIGTSYIDRDIMSEPLVTILIPHYKTLTLTQLCLRLLRKFTNLNVAKIIVIDNDSQDTSLDYLRSLSWIELIERQRISNETPVQSHSHALDLALERVTTPYVLSIHTDTLVKHPRWLTFLLSHLEQAENIAGVGSWKLEKKPWWRQQLKKIERQFQLFYYRLLGKTNHGLEGIGKNYYYLRSHCALYRTALLRKYHLHFSDGDQVAGKYLHQVLVDKGYQMVFLPSDRLIPYLEHVNHATTVLNPALSRQKNVNKGLKRIAKSLTRLNALQDTSLDV